MNTIKIVYLTILIAGLTISCEQDDQPVPRKTINVDLKPNQQYEYNTMISGDEEGVLIALQASNYAESEIVRNSSTNFTAIYRYKPLNNFEGSDRVILKLEKGSDGASPATEIEYIEINFVITE